VTQLTPQDIPDLESVISTAKLKRRPSCAPDYAAENRARLALTGLLNKQIAAKLGTSEATVKAHQGSPSQS
jgi:Bacterial regulatory proteins, luxR family